MENQIVCRNCKKTYSNNSVIDDAANGKGSPMQSIKCDCGERITYWQITDQLLNQKKLGWRFQNWMHTTFAHNRS